MFHQHEEEAASAGEAGFEDVGSGGFGGVRSGDAGFLDSVRFGSVNRVH
jgi:hypothetical protein